MYLVFNAFEKGYLSPLKRFLFLSIHRLYFIQVLHEIYIWKKSFFGAAIPFKQQQNTSGRSTALFEEQISPTKIATVDCSQAVTGGVFRNFAKFSGKYMCLLTLCLSTLIKKRLWLSCFSVNFTKFLRTFVLQNTFGRLLLDCCLYYMCNVYGQCQLINVCLTFTK